MFAGRVYLNHFESMQSKKEIGDIHVEKTGRGYLVKRGGIALATPAGRAYLLPTKELAEAIAAEWRSQSSAKKADLSAMPLTRLAATAIDVIADNRSPLLRRLAAFAESDTLCHLPEPRRAEALPLLAWVKECWETELSQADEANPLPRNAEAAARLREKLSYGLCDAFALAGLDGVAEATGSIVLALALREEKIGADDAFSLAEAESLHQATRWGLDPETEKRHKAVKDDIHSCDRWFRFLRG